MKRHASRLGAALALLALASCGPPILGSWKSGDQTSYYNGVYEPNFLTLGNDQTGTAIITYVLLSDSTVHTEQFEVTWKQKSDTDYTLTLSCIFQDGIVADCHTDDFVMSCTLPTTDPVKTFSCTGDGFFSQYPFTWIPNPPPS